MDWPEIIKSLEEKVAVSERQTAQLRRLLLDARSAATPAKSANGSEGPRRGEDPKAPQGSGGGASRYPDLSRMTQKAAILAAMKDAQARGEYVSPAYLRDWLEANGRFGDKVKSISAQLTGMKGKQVRKVGFGQWTLSDSEELPLEGVGGTNPA